MFIGFPQNHDCKYFGKKKFSTWDHKNKMDLPVGPVSQD